MHPLLNIATTAARKAGTVIMRAFDRLETVKILEKSVNDVVTDIDHLVEHEIIQIIHKSYPSHGILAEESGEKTGDDYTWIIDPIDGTMNFSRGIPHFAVSIAVQYRGKVEHSVVYDPVRQELFTASRGAGAKFGNYRMRVSACAELKDALLGTGFPHKNLKVLPEYMTSFQAFMTQTKGLRRAGSAALDLAYVAAGRLDGFWEYDLRPWDIAAGSLLVLEAGGLVVEPNGQPNYLESGNVVASNFKLLDQLLQVTKPA